MGLSTNPIKQVVFSKELIKGDCSIEKADSQSLTHAREHTHPTSMRKWTMSALLLPTACMRGLWPLLMSCLKKKKKEKNMGREESLDNTKDNKSDMCDCVTLD